MTARDEKEKLIDIRLNHPQSHCKKVHKMLKEMFVEWNARERAEAKKKFTQNDRKKFVLRLKNTKNIKICYDKTSLIGSFSN